MDVQPDEIEIHGTGANSKWFSSEGLNGKGKGVVLNYLTDTEEEVDALAHGLGIAHDVSMHTKAKYVGTRQDFLDMSQLDS